jgi:hypothetical protein
MSDSTFTYDDEILPEIEYFEIVSMEEIIKNNPTFIAFSKEDIYNEMYNFFKDKNKVSNFVELFYKIIDYKKKEIDITNYVIVTNSHKKDLTDENIEKFINSVKKLKKIQYKLSQDGINKLWYNLENNEDEELIRYKALKKTVIDLNDNVKYYVFKDDDTNIPVLSLYYLIPTSTKEDYLNTKIISHLDNRKIINNKIIEDTTKSIEYFLKEIKPKIPLEVVKLEEELDYSNLKAIFSRYDYDLDFINLKDLDELNIVLEKIVSNEKQKKSIHNNVKIKALNIEYNKFTFFDNLKNIKELIEITNISYEKYKDLIIKLNDEKQATSKFLYDNISDIVLSISKDKDALDTIAENIKIIKQNVLIDYIIKTINEYKDLSLDKTIILLDELEKNFNRTKQKYRDIFEYSFDIKNEEHLIEIGNNIKNYQGKNKNVFELFEDIDNNTEDIDFNITKISQNDFNIFYNTYKNEEGFVEILKIILPFINTIYEISNLPLNFDLLCNKLYNKFRGTPTKNNILSKLLHENSIEINKEELNKICIILPKNILNSIESDNFVHNYLIKANEEYVEILKDFLFTSIIWWSIQIQTELCNDTLLFEEQKLYPPAIPNWNTQGFPYSSTANDGTLSYLVVILEHIHKLKEQDEETNKRYLDDYIPKIADNFYKFIKKYTEENYEEELKILRSLEVGDNLKKRNRKEIGKEYQKILVENLRARNFKNLLEEYVNALLYMPSVKYEKIHKYLLGCCLQKIDKNFTADTDLINTRKDLMKVKTSFAKTREINKPRYLKFHPTKMNEKFKKNKEIKKIEYDLKEDLKNDIDVDEWLLNIKTKNNIIMPVIIVEDIQLTPKNITKYIDSYLKIFADTNLIKKEFIEIFKSKTFFNYKQIIFSINKIFYVNLKEYPDIQNFCIKSTTDIIKEIDILYSIINDDNKNEINKIISFIISRIICLPSDPNQIKGNVLKPFFDIDQKIIINMAKEIYTKLTKIFKSSSILTLEEQIDFVNKIREENKNKTLDIMNKKTEEERNIFKELKKIGIKTDENDDGNDDDIKLNTINEDNDEDYEDEENDYNIGEEDGIECDECLENHNYGFIYAD